MEFSFKSKLVFGVGKRHELSFYIKENSFKKIAIITDQSIYNQSIFRDFLDKLQFKFYIFKFNNLKPTYETLDREISKLKAIVNLDLIVAVGGGTIIDFSKGMSVMYKNRLPSINYRGFDKFSKMPLPLIAIPTTSGTGTEITPNASFIDSLSKKKMGINGEKLRPIFSILDPELTLSCPRKSTISSALDSIVHSTEAYVAKKTNHFARFFAKEGCNIVLKYLPLLVNNLNNVEFRSKVMYGAFLSANALLHSGTGPSAAMSYPLEVYQKIPHGISGAIFLPYVVEFNISKGCFDYSFLNQTRFDNLERGSLQFLKNLKTLYDKIKLKDLYQIDFSNSFNKRFVEDTLELKMALDQNPISFSENEVSFILNRLTKG